jgi:UrcA family protein
MTKLFLSIGLISAAIAASPALAQGEQVLTHSVQVADLNLGTANGIATLDRRIRQAVDSVCGRMQEDRVFGAEIARCRAATFAGTRPQRDLALNAQSGNRPIRVVAALANSGE